MDEPVPEHGEACCREPRDPDDPPTQRSDGCRDRRHEESAKQHRSDEPRLSQHPKLETVLVGRLVVRPAQLEVVDCEVVHSHANDWRRSVLMERHPPQVVARGPEAAYQMVARGLVLGRLELPPGSCHAIRRISVTVDRDKRGRDHSNRCGDNDRPSDCARGRPRYP